MILIRSGLLALWVLYGTADGMSISGNSKSLETKTLISSNFIGEATNELATAMLQESLKEDGNYVFSPIGYSTILAILAEGARGETRDQLATGLHLPEDLAAVRQAYKTLLNSLKEKSGNTPEFKNWFYAYKNYSIQSQYRDILLENYLTEVKAVEFEYYDNSVDDDLLSIDKKKGVNKIVVDEKTTDSKTKEDKNTIDSDKDSNNLANSQKEESTTEVSKKDSKDESNEVNKEKDESGVKDMIQSDIKKTSDESSSDKVPSDHEENNSEDKNTKTEATSQVPATEGKETVAEPVTDEDNKVKSSRNRMSLSRKIIERRHCLNKDTVTALTANRLSTTKKSEGDSENSNKRIIIFNGFYYKGNWKEKFHAVNDDTPEGKKFFYTSESEKKPIKMMATTGEFEIGMIPELESTAIEVPYEGDKYSLLILLPNNRGGLNKLASDLENFPLPKIDKYLKKKQVEVFFPKVNFYTISKPKPALLKSGIKDLFESKADLTGINAEGGLYLDELVQLVTMNFEEASTATNFLTSSLAVTRSNTGPEQFNANHPFFFFLRDRQDGLILAAGKLQDPTKTSQLR